MSRENLDLIRRLWDAAERRDSVEVFALYHPDIVWTSHEWGPLQPDGRFEGHDGVRRFFRDWLEAFETYEARADSFVEAGEQIVVGYRVIGRGTGSGVDVEMERWNLYTLADGLVTRVEVFENRERALDAAGSSE